MSDTSYDTLSDLATQLSSMQAGAWEEEILSQLPADSQDQARHLGAFVRVRGLRCAGDLLRGLLAYVLCAPSLRQVGIWGVVTQVADLSHVAWHKRLQRARAWVLWLLIELLAVSAPVLARPLPITRIVLIDATRLKAPGGTGDDWRAHLSYDLVAGRLLDVKLSDGHTAEGFHLFCLREGDVVVADRGYCRRGQLLLVCQAGAFLLVRLAVRQVPLLDAAGHPFDVVGWLTEQGPGQHSLPLAFEQDGQRVPVRLIAASLPEPAAQRAREKERKKAVKQQRQVQADTLFLCGWLVLLSTVPSEHFSDSQLLCLYRARWQIELLIKRLKQVLKLTQLRGKLPQTNEAILLLVLLALVLVQGVAARLREELSQLLCDWAQADAVASALTAAMPPPQEREPLACPSSWTLLAVCTQALRSIVAGQWRFAHLFASLPRLARYLCSRTGKRGHQESRIRRQLLVLLSGPPACRSPLFSWSRA